MVKISATKVEQHLRKIIEKEDKEISKAILFGSQARGDADETSDIDIALIDKSFEGTPMYKRGIWVKKNWDYIDIGPLEVICYTPKEFRKRLDKNGDTVQDIEKEGISLLI